MLTDLKELSYLRFLVHWSKRHEQGDWTLRAKQLPLLGSNLQILGQTVAELTVVKLPHPIVLMLLIAAIGFIAMNVQACTYLQKE